MSTLGTLSTFDKVMKGLGKTGEALGEGAGRVKAGVDNHFARYADDHSPYGGYLADQAAALGAVARHALGGGLIAGGANAVAYQNGAAWTGAESVGSAFMGGAAYGAVGGAALGATRFGIYSKANQIDRMVAHKKLQSANSVGKTGIWSGLKNKAQAVGGKIKSKADDALVGMANNVPKGPHFNPLNRNAHAGDPTLDSVDLRRQGRVGKSSTIFVPPGGF